jgi:hypothetical protein
MDQLRHKELIDLIAALKSEREQRKTEYDELFEEHDLTEKWNDKLLGELTLLREVERLTRETRIGWIHHVNSGFIVTALADLDAYREGYAALAENVKELK